MKIRLVGAESLSVDRRKVCVPCWPPKYKIVFLLIRNVLKFFKNYSLRIFMDQFLHTAANEFYNIRRHFKHKI